MLLYQRGVSRLLKTNIAQNFGLIIDVSIPINVVTAKWDGLTPWQAGSSPLLETGEGRTSDDKKIFAFS